MQEKTLRYENRDAAMIKRLISEKEEKYYTHVLKLLDVLQLEQHNYYWLVTDIDAYGVSVQLYKKCYLFTTKEFRKFLEKEKDPQWVWSVFSIIPSTYTKKRIREELKNNYPVIWTESDSYNPFGRDYKIQFPLAEIEIGAYDSTGMYIVTENEEVLKKFKEHYPNSVEFF